MSADVTARLCGSDSPADRSARRAASGWTSGTSEFRAGTVPPPSAGGSEKFSGAQRATLGRASDAASRPRAKARRALSVELRFDPAFVEEAVFLELGRLAAAGLPDEALAQAGAHPMASAFHREREAVYSLAEPQREAAFQQLAYRTFQALGLAELFTARLPEFPQVSERIELIIVRRVWNRKDEQVELYVARPTRRVLEVSTTLFIGLQAARCLDRDRLVSFLRHEFLHISDMLEPAFAYDPHAAFGGESEPEDELIRGRFRVLWDLWVHARMRRRRGWQTILDDEARRRDVMRAFAFLNPADQEGLVTAVSRRDRWTQGELLALAQAAHAHSAITA
ncbi:MAG: hypothetical protein HYS71_02225 [Candidatus Omnitrophica bacterium]|nr:hypothetical protein [Candidatus Omnitrophota bacterium]